MQIRRVVMDVIDQIRNGLGVGHSPIVAGQVKLKNLVLEIIRHFDRIAAINRRNIWQPARDTCPPTTKTVTPSSAGARRMEDAVAANDAGIAAGPQL